MPHKKKDKIRVIELFAGVGGFRLGLEGYKGRSAASRYSQPVNSRFEVVWSNQYEPKSKKQYASDVYRYRWPTTNHSSADIREIITHKGDGPILDVVPEHDMLVAGFPCQDYSVANTLKNAGGIIGEKGVLWWNIYWTLKKFNDAGRPTKYVLLENVDRLLKSPRGQRGRDFAIMLATLSDLGYAVEWRVVNAADYGMPQRRRRVFVVAYHQTTEMYEWIDRNALSGWTNTSVLINAFPVAKNVELSGQPSRITGNPTYLTKNFGKGKPDSFRPFKNFGVLFEREYLTSHIGPARFAESFYEKSHLIHYLHPESVTDDFLVDAHQIHDELSGWSYHKGPKALSRTDALTGYEYEWSEGGMGLFDDLNAPARTIITSEGGRTPSRSKHLITDPEGRTRRLLPIELDELSMFPPDHTRFGVDEHGNEYELPHTKRAFLVGNALVAGVVEKIGISLSNSIDEVHRACSEIAVAAN